MAGDDGNPLMYEHAAGMMRVLVDAGADANK